jgi:hypothetical protein
VREMSFRLVTFSDGLVSLLNRTNCADFRVPFVASLASSAHD